MRLRRKPRAKRRQTAATTGASHNDRPEGHRIAEALGRGRHHANHSNRRHARASLSAPSVTAQATNTAAATEIKAALTSAATFTATDAVMGAEAAGTAASSTAASEDTSSQRHSFMAALNVFAQNGETSSTFGDSREGRRSPGDRGVSELDWLRRSSALESKLAPPASFTVALAFADGGQPLHRRSATRPRLRRISTCPLRRKTCRA